MEYIWTGHRFIMEVHGTVSSSGIRVTLKAFFIYCIPVAATFEFMVSRVGLIAALLLMVDHFGPIRDTTTTIGTEKKKKKKKSIEQSQRKRKK